MKAPTIRLRKVADMRRDPENARTHSPEQLDQIKASIRRFGYTSPVLEDEFIRAGNGRHEAVEQMYAEGETLFLAPGADRGGAPLPPGTIPAIDCTGWSPEERQAYALADNQLAINAEWDNERLADQLRNLISAEFDMPIIGFDDMELNRLLGPPDSNTDPNEILQPPENPVSQIGDLWVLGDHRLLCGSSTDADCVARLLGDDQPVLMVTDPPYGVNYDPAWRFQARAYVSSFKKASRSEGKVDNDDRADWTEAWALFPGSTAYVWHGGLHVGEVQASLEKAGFEMRAQLIWRKQQFAIGRGNFHWQHEPCWYAVRKGQRSNWVGGRKQTTIWDIDNLNPVGRKGTKASHSADDRTGHGTQKPLECMRRPIENNSRPGEFIYEPFCGSGTTVIAGEMTRRRVLAVELDPSYCDVTVLRWQRFTGQAARLESGQTFAEVAAERGVELVVVPVEPTPPSVAEQVPAPAL